MEKKIKFVTLFCYKIQNVHLTKDVGMIPYMFYKTLNMNSELVTIRNRGEIYKSIANDVKGLKLNFISSFLKIPFTNIYSSAVVYLLRKSKSIDILNLYHLDFSAIILGLLYKKLNPNGILYIKLDLPANVLEKLLCSKTTFIGKIKVRIRKWYISQIASLISYENCNVENVIKDFMPKFLDKFIYIPNGLNNTHAPKVKDFEKKEKIILWVGRVGAKVKNVTYLLETLAAINLYDWKVLIIGPIESDFTPVIKRFKRENKEKKIEFIGNIKNKNTLYNYYNSAKIFCLTSDSEGFALVFSEALYYGNYILTRKVGGAIDITNNNKIGKIINSQEEFESQLVKIINEEIDLKKNYNLAKEHSNSFIWKEIIQKNSANFLNSNFE
jgi:glycosyltransferase involved in cell wall biosynthesis